MNSFIKNFKKNKIKTIKFDLAFNGVTKYKKIIKTVRYKLKQLNNLIPSYAQTENKITIYYSQHIFNSYIFKYGCPCSLKLYLMLLKKYKANSYEQKYYKQLYAYYLLKYISKTKLFLHFKDILTLLVVIKRKQKLSKKNYVLNTKIGAISNGSFLFVVCKNGYNYLQIDNKEITNFSHSLVKDNTIKLEIDSYNMLENANISIYKTHIIYTFVLGYLDIEIKDNLLFFNVKLQKNCNFNLIFDKNIKNIYKIKNKTITINNSIVIKNLTSNCNIINTKNSFGFSFINKNNVCVLINNTNYVYSGFCLQQYKTLQNELCCYYSTANYKLDNKELKQIETYNVNKQICCLPLLSKFNFAQTQKNKNINTYLLIERLNFNSSLLLPNINAKHLLTDGKVYSSLDIFLGKQTILLNNASYLYLDINCVNFYYFNSSKFIRVYLPTISKTIYINFSSSVLKIEKILNFLKITLKNTQNLLLTIDFERNTLKTNNIYRYFLDNKNSNFKSVNIDFNQPYFNKSLFIYETNNLNFFSEEFYILYCLANKTNIFYDNINNFNNINEVLYIFLHYSNWQIKHYLTVLNYIETKNLKPCFFQVALINYKTIMLNCIDNNIKHKLTDQIGQFNKTIVDSFYLGNFKHKKLISSFYYCFIYLMYVNNIVVENNIKIIDKIMFFNINNFKINLNNTTYLVNIMQKQQKKYCVNNVNYVGFSQFKTKNQIDIIV